MYGNRFGGGGEKPRNMWETDKTDEAPIRKRKPNTTFHRYFVIQNNNMNSLKESKHTAWNEKWNHSTKETKWELSQYNYRSNQ